MIERRPAVSRIKQTAPAPRGTPPAGTGRTGERPPPTSGAAIGRAQAGEAQAGRAQAGASLLFLRETQMREAQDLLFFAYRDFTAAADRILEEQGLGRAHHRALHYIGREPGLTVSGLLAVLRITKQSLARVLGVLVAAGFVAQTAGRHDRRQRLLSLTEAGAMLERRLFDSQRERLLAAYRNAGGVAVEGFGRVMRGVMDEATRRALDQPSGRPGMPSRRPGA